ncbi:glutamine-hydrolyzing carbamoyl-phosphate synthase small subunit [Ruminococcaceae bacterium OttesenSCG-928-O06]|nr:glutamine-hydrolyzing carbamoyl-phosphate synthase small subunit [Ruminococcaceae bacterium OttesenSCG-928-O06]
MQQAPKKLVFENGRTFYGTGFGADVQRVCEVVFNTSMVGYQEIYSDSSYNQQMVCMTYPLIGNYGMAAEDYESRAATIGGMIVREYNDSLANFRAAKTLGEEMEDAGIPGIQGVDTRSITRMIRSEGSMRAILCPAALPNDEALRLARETPLPHNQVASVSCKKRWHVRATGMRYNVAAIDCGIKLGIINGLAQRHCNVTVLPYTTTAAEVAALAPHGVLISNGPGNPEDVQPVIALVRELQGKVPVFGICIGHQLIALANGAKTYKLKFGHRGGNHPVRDERTGKIVITSQNHSYAVDAESLAGTGLALTHTNLLDGTVEGIENAAQQLFSVQYHPESKPGPQGSAYLFDQFIANMAAYKAAGRQMQ